MPRIRRIRPILGAALALAATAVAAPSAQAGPLVSSAASCDSYSYSQVFLPWGDVANYFALPGGSFETGAGGWTLNGSAVAAGNEPGYVNSSSDSHSLAIPSRASATSPSVCVGIGEPDMRFFYRRTSANMLATLKVDVLYEDAAGNVQSLNVATLPGSSSWQLSPQVLVVANLLPLLPNDTTAVAFRFTAQGGDFAIDDPNVDPWHCC